jgi:hypothetical protein
MIAIGVAGLQRSGCRTTLEDVIDDIDGITNVDRHVAVGIAAIIGGNADSDRAEKFGSIGGPSDHESGPTGGNTQEYIFALNVGDSAVGSA